MNNFRTIISANYPYGKQIQLCIQLAKPYPRYFFFFFFRCWHQLRWSKIKEFVIKKSVKRLYINDNVLSSGLNNTSAYFIHPTTTNLHKKLRSRLHVYVRLFLGRFSPPPRPLQSSSLPAPAHCRVPHGLSSGSVGGSHLFSAPTLTCCPWCGSSAALYC